MHVGTERILPEKIDTFAHEIVRSKLSSNLEAHRLKKDEEQLDGVTQVVVESRPPMDKLTFWARMDAAGLEDCMGRARDQPCAPACDAGVVCR